MSPEIVCKTNAENEEVNPKGKFVLDSPPIIPVNEPAPLFKQTEKQQDQEHKLQEQHEQQQCDLDLVPPKPRHPLLSAFIETKLQEPKFEDTPVPLADPQVCTGVPLPIPFSAQKLNIPPGVPHPEYGHNNKLAKQGLMREETPFMPMQYRGQPLPSSILHTFPRLNSHPLGQTSVRMGEYDHTPRHPFSLSGENVGPPCVRSPHMFLNNKVNSRSQEEVGVSANKLLSMESMYRWMNMPVWGKSCGAPAPPSIPPIMGYTHPLVGAATEPQAKQDQTRRQNKRKRSPEVIPLVTK